MNKHTFNWILRGWIGLASVMALVSGWVAFSHSPKPGAAVNAAANPTVNLTTSEGQFTPIPTLAPLPSVGSGSTSVQALPRQQAQTLSQPRLRTRGS